MASANLNKQLYTAIGQLLYYRKTYGESETKLLLVLSSVAVSYGLPHSKLFGSSDVFILFEEGGSFKSSKGRMLRIVLEDAGCITMRSTEHAKQPRAG